MHDKCKHSEGSAGRHERRTRDHGEQTTCSLQEAALQYAERGWCVLPVHEPTGDGGCSCADLKCKHQGKHPRTRRGFKDATTCPDQIRTWWKQWPSANIGIATGSVSGVWVLDIDPRNGGSDGLVDLEAEHGNLPATLTVCTGGDGYHLYFEHTEVEIGCPKLLPGVEVKGTGGYVVAPPSLHASGMRYKWGNR